MKTVQFQNGESETNENENSTKMKEAITKRHQLKIKFNKLYEDNKNNKALLAKILGIDLEKEFTREELIDKLEHCKPTEEEKKQLEKARLEKKELIKKKIFN